MHDDVLNDQTNLTLKDVCEKCGLDRETVTTYVEEGLLDISGGGMGTMHFSRSHIVRLQKATRLERDLRLNPAGSVLVLELMAEIESLKNQLKYFQRGDK